MKTTRKARIMITLHIMSTRDFLQMSKLQAIRRNNNFSCTENVEKDKEMKYSTRKGK